MSARRSDVQAARWRRLQDVFEASLARNERERRAFVERECPDDPQLQAQLGELLAAAADEHRLPDRALGASFSLTRAIEIDGDLTQLMTDPVVGGYRLERRIGAGALHDVYAARRVQGAANAAPLALKLLRWSRASDQALRRFRAEAQILATLNHAGIPRLIDAGECEHGMFIVQELVDGEPITEFCEARSIPLRGRIELLLQACEALQHAHDQSVLHLDIKPSHIVVSATGEPRLIDFGIGKRSGRLGECERVTMFSDSRFTLAYASPEQIREEPLSPASDVFGLAVVLYELVSGRLPFAESGDSVFHIARAICHDDPPSVLALVRQNGVQHAPSAASTRVGSARHPGPYLAQPLQWVLAQALRKNPADRYATVAGFAADLRRCLSGDPVTARAESSFSAIRRFAHRHRYGVAFSAGIFLALSIGLLSTCLALRNATAERSRAQSANADLAAVFAFFESSLTEPNTRVHGRDTALAEVLGAASAGVPRAFPQPSVVRADTRLRLSRAYRSVSLLSDAEQQARHALADLAAVASVEPSLRADANLELAAALFEQRRYAESLAPANAVVDLLEHSREPAAIRAVVEALTGLCYSYVNCSDTHQAEQCAQRAAALLDRAAQPLGVQRVMLLCNWALARIAQGDLAEARTLLERARRLAVDLGDDGALLMCRIESNIGKVDLIEGDFVSAKARFSAAYESQRGIVGDAHADLAMLLRNLGIVSFRLGDAVEAECYTQECLAMEIAIFGSDFPGLIDTLTNLATYQRRLRRLDEARRSYQRAFEIGRAMKEPPEQRLALLAKRLSELQVELDSESAAVVGDDTP